MELTEPTLIRYKYMKKCKACVWFSRHPKEKLVLANIDRFNKTSHMTVRNFQMLYAPSLNYQGLLKHVSNHIYMADKPIVNALVNDKSPEGKALEGTVVHKEQFESTLDEFINQFDEGLRSKQFKLTVKDGLTALKIKADLVNKNKDRKADVLKALAGARGERQE